jgi:hypothetical protein
MTSRPSTGNICAQPMSSKVRSRRCATAPCDAFGSLTLGDFLRGRYDQAASTAYKAVQSNPAHSISYVLLAAPLAKLGRLEEAKAAAARVLEFTICIPVQPAIFRRGLRAGACRLSKRGAPRRGAAGITFQFVECILASNFCLAGSVSASLSELRLLLRVLQTHCARGKYFSRDPKETSGSDHGTYNQIDAKQ